MVVINIQNPEADPKAVGLVKVVDDSITQHWRALFPATITVHVADQILATVPELAQFWAVQDLPENYREGIQVACPEYGDDDATLWVHFDHNSVMSAPEYYFKKEVYAALGQLLWFSSVRLQELLYAQAPWLNSGNRAAGYVAFRDTFSRFFLNPEWLQDKKPDAWSVIAAIDKELARLPAA